MAPQSMQETLLLKSILQKKKLQECTLSIPTIDKSKLILERQLSLSHLIPNCSKWRIITQEHKTCYICDQHIIGVFFWSKEIHKARTSIVTEDTKRHYIRQSQQLYNEQKGEITLPTIQAAFTNWEPVALLELSQLCMQINGSTEPNWIEILI